MWKDAKDYIKAMPAWKKFLWFAAVAAGTLLMLTFLIWAFCQHGTIGLFRVNGTYRIAFQHIYLLYRCPAVAGNFGCISCFT